VHGSRTRFRSIGPFVSAPGLPTFAQRIWDVLPKNTAEESARGGHRVSRALVQSRTGAIGNCAPGLECEHETGYGLCEPEGTLELGESCELSIECAGDLECDFEGGVHGSND
jgi:hypothetical protein